MTRWLVTGSTMKGLKDGPEEKFIFSDSDFGMIGVIVVVSCSELLWQVLKKITKKVKERRLTLILELEKI